MVAKRWSIDDAERHLREVLDQATNDGPQEVTRDGETFVIVSASAWRNLTGGGSAPEDPDIEDDDYRQSLNEIHQEFNRAEFRNPFAWVDEMSDAEVDAWEQRLEQNRKRMAEAGGT